MKRGNGCIQITGLVGFSVCGDEPITLLNHRDWQNVGRMCDQLSCCTPANLTELAQAQTVAALMSCRNQRTCPGRSHQTAADIAEPVQQNLGHLAVLTHLLDPQQPCKVLSFTDSLRELWIPCS